MIIACMICAAAMQANAVDMEFVPDLKDRGISIPFILLDKGLPPGLKNAPTFENPWYGENSVGGNKFLYICDMPKDKPWKLYVDFKGHRDLSEDQAVELPGTVRQGRPGQDGKPGPSSVMYRATANFEFEFLGHTYTRAVNYMTSEAEGDHPDTIGKRAVAPMKKYAFTGTITLAGKPYDARIVDHYDGDFMHGDLEIDINGDGNFMEDGKSFPADKPFNVGGVTYNLTFDNGQLGVTESKLKVASTYVAPRMLAGDSVLNFKAKTMDGTTVNFPSSYKGKVVLIDFWATWCAPCMAEMPNVIKNYRKYKDSGFEVLGVTLDDTKSKVLSVTKAKGMPWPQIFDGKGWKADLALRFSINAIPHGYLIDGTTGAIIAQGTDIQGEKLGPAIEKGLSQIKHAATGSAVPSGTAGPSGSAAP